MAGGNGGRSVYYRKGGLKTKKQDESENKEALREVGSSVSTNPADGKVASIQQSEAERNRLRRLANRARYRMTNNKK